MRIRKYQSKDLDFVRFMLFEAVFWRDRTNAPALEIGLAYDGVRNALEGWPDRPGDQGVIALGDEYMGAAWFRYFNESNQIRGYYSPQVPVVVIGVAQQHRQNGVGAALMEALGQIAKNCGISQLSLCVSKDNHAYHLYQRCGYEILKDIGDSWIMVKNL